MLWYKMSILPVILLLCLILLSCQTTNTTSGNVDDLRKELKEVNQRVEEIHHRLSIMQSIMDDHGGTITELEGIMRKIDGTVNDSNLLPLQQNIPLPSVKKENNLPESLSHTGHESGTLNEISIVGEKPDEIYQQGLADLKRKDYHKALTKFQIVLSNYPEHHLADNAAYWTGEVYYVQNDFSKAIQIFKNLIKKHPKAGKAGDAMLKIGYSYYAMEDDDNAVKYLNQVMVYYPSSHLRKKAETVLNKIEHAKKISHDD